MPGHTWHKCRKKSCALCKQPASYCTKCGGFKETILFHCPGQQLSGEALQAINSGKIVDLVYWKATHKYRRTS